MLNKRQKRLISYLYSEPDWVTGAILSERLLVTSRTIRTDVAIINAGIHGLIESSPYGYRFNKQMNLPSDILSLNKFACQEERTIYVLSRLLTAQHELNIDDLADELYISSPTLYKDVKHMQSRLEEAELSLVRKGGTVKVEGKEKNRRKLLSNLVYTELGDQFHEMISFAGFFEEKELYRLKKLFFEVMDKEGVSANVFTSNAIILHIAIALQRIREQQYINDEDYNQPSMDGYREFLLAKKITARIEEEFSICLPIEEVCALAYNLIGKIRADRSDMSVEQLREIMDNDFLEIAKGLLLEVEHAYELPIYDDNSFIRFAVHIYDVIVRLRNNQTVKNPMKDDLKRTYPMIYDIAVFMAGKFQEKFDYTLSEEEIAFLAIHIGASLEQIRYKRNQCKLEAILLCPQFYTIHTSIIETIEKNRPNSLAVTRVLKAIPESFRNFSELMILTTVDTTIIPKVTAQEIVPITPFLKPDDFKKIDEAAKRIHDRLLRNDFESVTLSWFRPSLFFDGSGIKNEWEAIETIAGRMFALKYVPEDFADQVKARERLSRTTFGGAYAIPHSTKMDARETCIGVMIAKEPIQWDGHPVSIVLLMAIRQDNRQDFIDFYDELANLLVNAERLAKLQSAKDYEDFISILKTLI